MGVCEPSVSCARLATENGRGCLEHSEGGAGPGLEVKEGGAVRWGMRLTHRGGGCREKKRGEVAYRLWGGEEL